MPIYDSEDSDSIIHGTKRKFKIGKQGNKQITFLEVTRQIKLKMINRTDYLKNLSLEMYMYLLIREVQRPGFFAHKQNIFSLANAGTTVEPVYNGHPRDLRNWPLNTGGRLIQDH